MNGPSVRNTTTDDDSGRVPPRPEGRGYRNKPGEPGSLEAITPRREIDSSQPGSPGLFL
jgi:hypothetical protein